MTDLEKWVPSLVLQHLSAEERQYLEAVFDRFNGFPSLEQVWMLMDEPWVELGCDPLNMDERVTEYYRHPVWMLNGLFIEQHTQSLENRRVFTDWVASQTPERVADFGGGFCGGGLLVSSVRHCRMRRSRSWNLIHIRQPSRWRPQPPMSASCQNSAGSMTC